MDDVLSPENTAWLEEPIVAGLRLWHVIGIVTFGVLSVIVLLCCCFRFRIPRTKQEIEADYQRRKIVRKFKKKIQKFEDAEMDAEMDLKKALEKIRNEFQQDDDCIKLKEDSSDGSNDESHYDDGRKMGAKKKRLLSVPKRDQLINTIYQGYNSETTNPPSPVNHFSSLEVGAGGP